MYDEQDEILRFLGATLQDFHTDKKLQDLRKSFIFYAKYAIRRENEFVLMKCQFFKQPGTECTHCVENPPTSELTLKFLENFKGKLLQPSVRNTSRAFLNVS